MHPVLIRFTASLSAAGLLVGTLFFAASLTPSLLPRTYVMQGMLSGGSLAAGYGIGVFGRWLWSYLELPMPGRRTGRIALLVASLVCLAVALIFLRQAAEWQNSIRSLMGLDPVDSAHPFRVGGIAFPVFVALLGVARLFALTYQLFARKLHLFIPRRVAHAIGGFLAVALFWSVINGVLFEYALRAADSSFQQIDALIEPEVQRPDEPYRTGSAESLIAWEDLGSRGREFVSSGPSGEMIAHFLGGEVLEPLRVYVGLNSDESIEARAQLALTELKRVGGFERSVLIVVTPTGTGWIDPKAMDTVEFLHRGDVASVAVQYSYLPSWLSLMVEPDYGADTARAVFAAIYGYWTELPPDLRPKLYLHGLSLGALNSDRGADFYDVIADPYSGALWSGPPYRSSTWRTVTELRDPDSPAWLPRFRDGSIVRFTNQHDALDVLGAQWGPMRIVFLQYASDPVTFFEPQALYRSPSWMSHPRGPEISTHLRWFPVVTMLQLAIDVAAGDSAPVGYGHVYAPEHYIDAWLAVTEPEGWTEEEIARLKSHFSG
ncbi:MAG: alpha/beta-hydrolase family protein [Gemmatimonadota bacterium]